jgi:hypothetical protein
MSNRSFQAASEFSQRALGAGVKVIVAYTANLRSNWSFTDMPVELAAQVDEFVTGVTRAMADGVHEEAALRARLIGPLEHITAWCEENESHQDVRLFCEGVNRAMRVLLPP